MTHRFAEIAFTPGVQQSQADYGSAEHNRRLLRNAGPNDALGPREAEFIQQRDSFYLATVSETGWPYVQHRGGPVGFVKVLNEHTFIWPDFRGNLQLVSAGNTTANNRCSIIFMDYANRRRLKVLGHLAFEDVSVAAEQDLEITALASYRGRIERIATVKVAAFDWNCPQHITRRYTEEEIAASFEPITT